MNPQNLQENFDSIKALKKQLERFPASKLSTENQMVYDILRLQFATELSSENCYLLQEPLSPNLGIQAQLPALLAEYTFRTPADVKDYLSLLTSLPDYFKEIQQFEQEKSRQGLFMSDDSAERTVQQCKEFCEDLNSHYLSETFKDRAQKLTELKVISKKQRDSYIKTHEKILKNCVFPAYKSLAQSLEKLKGSGKNQGGLCHLPEGKKYYAYLIKSSTGDYRSVREIQKHLYQQLFLDFEEIQNLVQKDPDIFTKAAQLPQTASSSPEQMLDYLSRVMTDDFPKLTVKDYEVKYVPDSMEEFSSPAFYLTPPVDTLTPNTIYINQSTTVSDVQRFTTLAHEGFPGHLYQTVYFGKQDCPPIRHLLGCGGYGISPPEPLRHPLPVLHSGYRYPRYRLESANRSGTFEKFRHYRRKCLPGNLSIHRRKSCQLPEILSGIFKFYSAQKQCPGNPGNGFQPKTLSSKPFGNRARALPHCEKIFAYAVLKQKEPTPPAI